MSDDHPSRHQQTAGLRASPEGRPASQGVRIDSLAPLAELLRIASRERFDFDRARELAKVMLRQVKAGKADPDRDHEAVMAAAEHLWDHDRIDEAQTLVVAWANFIQAEKLTSTEVTDHQLLARDLRAAHLRAAVLHRTPSGVTAAWYVIRAGHRMLTDRTGGSRGLSALVAAAPFEGIGLLYTELLDMAIPVGRRVTESLRKPYVDVFLDDAKAVIAQLRLDGHYHGHASRYALVDQTLFALLDQGDPDNDGDLVARYYTIDARLRPKDRRGLATRHLLNMEIARYYGNTEGAELYVMRAVTDLKSAGLSRHLEQARSQYF